MILDNNTLSDTSLRVLDILIDGVKASFVKAFNISDGIDIISYTGDIGNVFEYQFMEFIELVKNKNKNNILAIILTTPGGSATSAERMVNIMRANYKEVYFIVPESAMSAGTILCMSGDKIFMDYFSALGPIDPQVPDEKGRWVPALGYIDKVNELIEKSKNDELSPAEFALLQGQDLGTIRAYEQARDLSESLLKDWLVKYKFKDWNKHKDGINVTKEQKEARAEEIAKNLSDNKKWHTHGRYINIKILQEDLKLKIENYTDKKEFRANIKEYMKLLKDHIIRLNRRIYFHAKLYK